MWFSNTTNIYLRFDYALNNYGIMSASELWDSIFTETDLATYSQCCSSEPCMKFRADTQRFKSILTLLALENLSFFSGVVFIWNE